MANLKNNFIYNTLLGISQILFPLITFPYASRILLPEGIGSVSFIDSFTQYFITIAALGIPVYGVREIAKRQQNKYELNKLFSELITIHFSVSVLAIILYWLIVINLAKFSPNLDLCSIGVILILSSTFLIEWLYQGLEKFRFVVIRTLVIRSLTILLLFVLVKSSQDKSYYYGLNIVSAVIGAAVNLYMSRRFVSFTLKNLELTKHLKPLLIILSTSVVISVYTLLDTILLGFLTNNKIVGYYSATLRVGRFPLAIVGALGAVLIPRLSNMFKNKNHDEANILLEKSLSFSLLLSVPIAFGTLCLSHEIIELFAGNDFIDAVQSLKIFSFVVIFVGLAQVYSQQILLPIGKENYILKASVIGMIISLISNIVLIPLLGHIGAALSNVFTELIVTIVLFHFSRQFVQVRFPFKQFILSVATCSSFFLVKSTILFYTTNIILVVVFTIIISALIYIAFQLFIWKNQILSNVLKSYFS